MLEWSTTGKLLFWESIWEGPGITFVYDPVTTTMLASMRADRETALMWNPQKTAFYAARNGGYGANDCVGELNGYDFQSNHRFPDLYKVFNVEKVEKGDAPYTYLIGDNLYIEPFGWSQDGKRLWVTVTPLDWKGDDAYSYLVEPRQTGVFELSDTGVRYIPLIVGANFDYFFEGLPDDPRIASKVYRPRICPPQ